MNLALITPFYMYWSQFKNQLASGDVSAVLAAAKAYQWSAARQRSATSSFRSVWVKDAPQCPTKDGVQQVSHRINSAGSWR